MAQQDDEATLVLKVAYDGAPYSGFAEQKDERLDTVAGELRRALETLLRREVQIVCAGRTDAGVHALAQHVSVPVFGDELLIPRRRFERALPALLPPQICLKGAYRARAGFSARFDARSRAYRYRIVTGPFRPLYLGRFAWWHRGELDAAAMDRAARLLVGEHDFKSFCKASSAEGKPTCREVFSCSVVPACDLGEWHLALDIVGNAFLHSMVRTVAGTLVEVGAHRREELWVREVLEARDRCAAGPTAPAQGLSFMAVAYPEGSLRPWPAEGAPAGPEDGATA